MNRFSLKLFRVTNLLDPKVADVLPGEHFTDITGSLFYKHHSTNAIITLVSVTPNPILNFTTSLSNIPTTLTGHNISIGELNRRIEAENNQILLNEDLSSNIFKYIVLLNSNNQQISKADLNARGLNKINSHMVLSGTNFGYYFGRDISTKKTFNVNDGTIIFASEFTFYDSSSVNPSVYDSVNNRFIFGLTNFPMRNDIGNLKGVFFDINTTNNKFMCCNEGLLTQTLIDTDITAQTNTKYWLKLVVSAIDTKFYIDGVLKGTITTAVLDAYLVPNTFTYALTSSISLIVSKIALLQNLTVPNDISLLD